MVHLLEKLVLNNCLILKSIGLLLVIVREELFLLRLTRLLHQKFKELRIKILTQLFALVNLQSKEKMRRQMLIYLHNQMQLKEVLQIGILLCQLMNPSGQLVLVRQLLQILQKPHMPMLDNGSRITLVKKKPKLLEFSMVDQLMQRMPVTSLSNQTLMDSQLEELLSNQISKLSSKQLTNTKSLSKMLTENLIMLT